MTDHCNARYSMALYRCVDVLRRCDEDWAKKHGLEQTTDEEFNAAIYLGEEVLDELSTDDEQRDLFGHTNSERRYSR